MTITIDVLAERQDQQHAQTIVALVRIEDHLIEMNGTIHNVQITTAEQELRLKCGEDDIKTVKVDMKEVQNHYVKVAIAIALLTGIGMAGAQQVFGLVVP